MDLLDDGPVAANVVAASWGGLTGGEGVYSCY